jgi:ornithine decarboxylase
MSYSNTVNFSNPKEVQWKFAEKLYKEFTQDRPDLPQLLEKVDTPTLVIRKDKLQDRYREVIKNFDQFKVYYAVKANDHIEVIKTFAQEGAGFEIASPQELEKVLSVGTPPEKIISSNPVKPLDFIDICLKNDIDRFAVDSFAEVDKIARFKKRARVYVRLAVPNVGSDWPLSRKFGVDVETALEILDYAKEKGLIPYGLTFHVGSQCNNLQNWFVAIKRAKELWDRAATQKGIRLQMLNIGGGIPARYTRESLSVEEIACYIKGLLNKYFNVRTLELQMEPGRGLVAEAGLLVVSVIGKAKRGKENWLYIDSGVFHGLAEALGGIRYSFYTPVGNPKLTFYTIGGISCDSMDVVAQNVALPENITVGDRVFILTAGAYTTVYASHFNGFPPPKVLLV